MTKGRCEGRDCGHIALKWGNKGTGSVTGNFHHTRSPSVSPTEKTVRFVCPNCHSKLHEYTTKTTNYPLAGQEKRRVTLRKDVKRKVKRVRKKRETSKKTDSFGFPPSPFKL